MSQQPAEDMTGPALYGSLVGGKVGLAAVEDLPAEAPFAQSMYVNKQAPIFRDMHIKTEGTSSLPGVSLLVFPSDLHMSGYIPDFNSNNLSYGGSLEVGYTFDATCYADPFGEDCSQQYNERHDSEPFGFHMPGSSTSLHTPHSPSLPTTPYHYEPAPKHLNWEDTQPGSPMVYPSQQEVAPVFSPPPRNVLFAALDRQQVICQWTDDCKDTIKATPKALQDHIDKRHCPEVTTSTPLRCQWTSHKGGPCGGQDAKIGRHILTKCHVLTMPNGEEFKLKAPCSRCGKLLGSKRPDSVQRHIDNGTCAREQDKNRTRKEKGTGRGIKNGKRCKDIAWSVKETSLSLGLHQQAEGAMNSQRITDQPVAAERNRGVSDAPLPHMDLAFSHSPIPYDVLAYSYPQYGA
ncbi:hypothetical protein BKA70DRAFT_1450393 [Coprinopsis sp. MPI-PUGE-AT-0042]|nr:hypothetical protein BKA70DRAFT_1450393 [Coprinopsis sp. MPI-PUGE-AT-0042]